MKRKKEREKDGKKKERKWRENIEREKDEIRTGTEIIKGERRRR